MSKNIENMNQKLDSGRLKANISQFIDSINWCWYNNKNMKKEWMKSFHLDLTDMFPMIGSFQATTEEMIRVAEERIEVCVSLLESYPVKLFAPNCDELVTYYEKYGKKWDKIFDESKPELPKTVPHLDNPDHDVEITTENYDLYKQIYDHTRKIYNGINEHKPTQFPVTLPNLGTNDGRPDFEVNEKGFYVVMKAYYSYVDKLEMLISSWKVNLKKLEELSKALEPWVPSEREEAKSLLKLDEKPRKLASNLAYFS
eukprot:TRINITY_DN3307_c0_g1_i1.p1 TRINITY_DN3307_c0_g1~~TRINITY_DN3307_c0_g1_i1.p1  ORF type:complete len:256 (-),score=47.54 TRINITY_DN3307_c0_g1_i1:286-1053(-)